MIKNIAGMCSQSMSVSNCQEPIQEESQEVYCDSLCIHYRLDSKNSKEPQQKYRLGTVSIKILGGLNQARHLPAG